MNTYIVIHEHRHGFRVYAMSADHWPTEQEAVKCCNIPFEENRDDEWIMTYEMPEICILK